MSELTPMMKQYLQIKEQYSDCILFFRLGDFYEMFKEDAVVASKELDLTLTTRDRKEKDPEKQTPMCGVPYHSCEAYIARLIAKGYKVAICEQTEDPNLAKGLVRRDIVKIVTPGTVIDSTMLDESKNNFIASIFCAGDSYAVSFADISTGEMFLTSSNGTEVQQGIINEMAKFMPAEVIVNGEGMKLKKLVNYLKDKLSCLIERNRDEGIGTATENIKAQFEGIDLGKMSEEEICSVGSLIAYLKTTQKTDLSHINEITVYGRGQCMELDATARRNLEICETIRSKEKKGTLLWVLDRTKTSMGSRMIRSWLARPLVSPTQIITRHKAVYGLVKNTIEREEIIRLLEMVSDIERLIGRVVYGSANGRDLVSMSDTIRLIPQIREKLSEIDSKLLKEVYKNLDTLEDIANEIDSTLKEKQPFSIKEGNMIKEGFDETVDELHEILNGGQSILTKMEAEEKQKTGIRTLRIGYNRVFGYYIEVSNSFKESVPERYIRKQTTVNGERYITPELKEMESKILTAQERVVQLELEIFNRLRENVARHVVRVQKTAHALATLDVLCSYASVAVKNNYCMPEIDDGDTIDIKDGRHPVVEQVLNDSVFVANDVLLDGKDNSVIVLTGPNMAGKSTYMRQVALICLMAQAGSFVPASSAKIGVVDRIFTRIGASDDLASGQSTFMVEMNEVADILKYATRKSLIVLDEVGRGTSTFDGMSIARALIEYIIKKVKAKTLFATHYHELTSMETEHDGIKNYNIAVKKRGNDIIFLRKIVRGGTDDSYGIEVARLAGLPQTLIDRANEILKDTEKDGRVVYVKDNQSEQMSMDDLGNRYVSDRLKEIELNTLTPIEAMNILFELKNKVD